MTARPSPDCPACAERAPELHETAEGDEIVSIDLGWRLAVRVKRIDAVWSPVDRCYVIDADGTRQAGVTVTIGTIGKLHDAVEAIR